MHCIGAAHHDDTQRVSERMHAASGHDGHGHGEGRAPSGSNSGASTPCENSMSETVGGASVQPIAKSYSAVPPTAAATDTTTGTGGGTPVREELDEWI